MADKEKSPLTVLREQYKEALGKNPSPKLDADGLSKAIAEAQAAAANGGDKPEAEKQPDPAPKAEKPKAAKKPEAVADVPAGAALLDHDDPDASASFAGVDIVRALEGKAKGLFLVPLHAVEELLAHGFKLIKAAL